VHVTRHHHATTATAVALAATLVGAQSNPIRFDPVAADSGVRFALANAPTPDKRLIETMPGGLAAFDYNSDGRIDLYFTNGASGEGFDKTAPRFWNRLFRNDGDWRFTDVTESAGLAGATYAIGAASADFDNDGDQDIFVAGLGRNQLFRNDGAGHFIDVAEASGIGPTVWSVAGAWLDYDRDGRLDLFVVNYVQWRPGPQRFCGDRTRDLRVYCHPKYFDGLPNTLYRNKGDGTFEDVTRPSGLGAVIGKGMSAVTLDIEADGWPDLYVTNDSLPSVLLRNTGKRTFEDIGLLAGVALPGHGRPVSAMGVDAADYDGDGRPDLAVTALAGETFPLYRNEGGGAFRDAGVSSGLGALTVRRSGWGIVFGDFDNDGEVDLFTANSHVNDRIEQFEASTYLEPNRVYRNTGKGRFADVSPTAGDAFQQPAAHRGAVAADFDGDGRLDVATTALGSLAVLWRNVTKPRHWLQVALIGTRNPRDGIGATVRVGGRIAYISTATSYASSKPPIAHFGLGDATSPPEIEVTWPDGTRQTVKAEVIDRVIAIRQAARPGVIRRN
jgi:enediyne biosynthesis protein E4